jgi:hypothetical protein
MLYREIIAVCSEIHNKLTYDALRDAVRRFHQGVLYLKNVLKCQGTRQSVISYMPTLKIAVHPSTNVHGTHKRRTGI